MAKPTDNDWKLFQTVRNGDKATVLYAYLCQGYNMVETAQVALNDNNDMASQRVSNITRCYGFSGQNGGRYKKYGLNLNDIKGFVRKYPNGCDDYRIMDEYVKKLYESRQSNINYAQQTNAQPQNSPIYDRNESEQERPITREQQKFARIVLCIGAAIIFVCKVILSWNWIVSIIAGVLVIGAIEMLRNK